MIRILNNVCKRLASSYWNFRARIQFAVRGVAWPKNLRVLGKLGLSASGTIVLGESITIINDSKYNRAGVNHPSQLVTSAGATLRIGNNVGMSGVVIYCQESIEIGDHVLLGANSKIYDTDFHSLDHLRRRAKEPPATQPVRIEDDVWLCKRDRLKRRQNWSPVRDCCGQRCDIRYPGRLHCRRYSRPDPETIVRRMTRVLVFETGIAGHRPYYVKVLCEELQSLPGIELSLAIPENTLDTAEGQTYLESVVKNSQLIELPSLDRGLSVSSNAQARLNLLISAAEKTRAEHIYVPYADGISQAWGMRLAPQRVFGTDVELEGLMMRGSFAYPSTNLRDRLGRKIGYYLQKRSGWTVIHQLDPLVFWAIQKSDPVFFRRNRLIPELIEPLTVSCRKQARQILGLNPQDQVVVCPGAVNEQKGADLLIEAFSRLDDCPQARLLLFGRHSPGVCRALQSATSQSLISQGRIISRNEFASVQEFDSLFSAADLIAVLYPHHIGSSSILIRAAASGKPVLASDWGWIGWATRQFGLGTVIENKGSVSIAESIRQILNAKRSESKMESGNASSFVEFHSRDNHLAHWTSYLREKLGLPQRTKTVFPEF